MNIINENIFAAKESNLGYFYQILYGFVKLLKARSKGNNISITIENIDDISIHQGDKIDVFQTKYHLNKKTNLTDKNIDFWKTLRVWAELISNGTIKPETTIFNLITTSTVSANSFLKVFTRQTKRDLADIRKELENISNESSNPIILKSFSIFNSLNSNNKENLIKNIFIVDNSETIKEVEDQLLNELKISAPIGKLQPFYERIVGWWFKKVVNIIDTKKVDFISLEELLDKISDIRDTFQNDNLPIDFLDNLQIVDDNEKTYVKQLKLIKIGDNTVNNAKSDYYRAFEQRAKWLKDNLIKIEEEEKYEKRLFDYWKIHFDMMIDELNNKEDLDELINLGYIFYKNYYIDRLPNIFFRDKVTQDFIFRGSSHMLADIKKIGWHPQYLNLIK